MLERGLKRDAVVRIAHLRERGRTVASEFGG
jgi:hypothetical protein